MMSRILGGKEIILVDYFDKDKCRRRRLLCPGDVRSLLAGEGLSDARCSRKERFVKSAQYHAVGMLRKYFGARAQVHELCRRVSRGMYVGESVGGQLHIADIAQIIRTIYPLDCGLNEAKTYCSLPARAERFAKNKELVSIFRSLSLHVVDSAGVCNLDESTIHPELTTTEIYELAFFEDIMSIVQEFVEEGILRLDGMVVSPRDQNEDTLMHVFDREPEEQKRSLLTESFYARL